MNAAGHQLFNFTVTAASLFAVKDKPGMRPLPHPVVAAPLSAVFASLPDILEPALNPHHRQLFHCLAFAGLVGIGVHEAYQWEPETPAQEVLRLAALIVGSAYLLHLVADMFTPRGLPLIGRQ